MERKLDVTIFGSSRRDVVEKDLAGRAGSLGMIVGVTNYFAGTLNSDNLNWLVNYFSVVDGQNCPCCRNIVDFKLFKEKE